MRLYPVAPFLTRILPKECMLGPYILKAGVSKNITYILSVCVCGDSDRQNSFINHLTDEKLF